MSNKIITGGGQWLLLRRQFLEKKGSNEEMKEWVTLVNESKTVENLNTIEFNLANAEFHDEFRLYIEIDKNANADEKMHNLRININGMNLGYYLLNTKWNSWFNKYYEVEKKPKPRILTTLTSTFSLAYNGQQTAIMIDQLGNETGSGKLTFSFPKDYTYTGTIKVQLYAR